MDLRGLLDGMGLGVSFCHVLCARFFKNALLLEEIFFPCDIIFYLWEWEDNTWCQKSFPMD